MGGKNTDCTPFLLARRQKSLGTSWVPRDRAAKRCRQLQAKPRLCVLGSKSRYATPGLLT